MRYYTQKTNRQLGGRAIRLTCVTTQFSKLKCTKGTYSIGRQTYGHIAVNMIYGQFIPYMSVFLRPVQGGRPVV